MIILALLPILGGTGGLIGWLISKFTLEAQNSYALAGATAEQVLYGIRTVYSFSLQERFAALYAKQLVNARKTGVKRGVSLGCKCHHSSFICVPIISSIILVLFGFFLFVLFCTYGLSFWYGGKLVSEGKMTGTVS